MAMEFVKLIFWHGGSFSNDPKLGYVGGKCEVYDQVDMDELCWWYLLELAQKCDNYKTIDAVYYVIPGMGFEKGLKRVFVDKEVLEMVGHLKATRVIELYVVHGVDVPEIIPECNVPVNPPPAPKKTVVRPKLQPKRAPSRGNANTGRATGRRGRGRASGNMPTGFGVLISEDGNTYLNRPGLSAPINVSQFPSSQVSTAATGAFGSQASNSGH